MTMAFLAPNSPKATFYSRCKKQVALTGWLTSFRNKANFTKALYFLNLFLQSWFIAKPNCAIDQCDTISIWELKSRDVVYMQHNH